MNPKEKWLYWGLLATSVACIPVTSVSLWVLSISDFDARSAYGDLIGFGLLPFTLIAVALIQISVLTCLFLLIMHKEWRILKRAMLWYLVPILIGGIIWIVEIAMDNATDRTLVSTLDKATVWLIVVGVLATGALPIPWILENRRGLRN